ncbi:uncharacterized protein BDZ99DRAFT_566929 [Mytilinidion resinicola]|uniref:Rdx family-domain-containing protein n=1 Tax=Mytilinidion resinicola TaxID=574789 RepID=A0A6A6Z2Q4_9PEZI|nr:uncharacterized protein BDZ99DRAFT_566929 [Mytilinidion resinicola]KAF2815019.1 hypothetical protein BDZ99DRAFT_566929 [Mytilinidion resinicola]
MATSQTALPRIAITFCTQCRWMLRAAYFAQELLSTFSTTIGEVALIPATGGLFTVELTYIPLSTAPEDSEDAPPSDVKATKVLLWDRKAEGGFPGTWDILAAMCGNFAVANAGTETKILKQLVRDHLDPKRDLGHSDKHGKKKIEQGETPNPTPETATQSQEANALTTGVAKAKLNSDGTVCEDCK